MSQGKIKILHVIDSLAVGGMERVVIDVVNGLDPGEFEQTVCCLSRRGEAAAFLHEGVRCIDLAKGAKADRLMPLKIARVIRDERPDIIHSQSWSGIDAGIGSLIAHGAKLVHSEHGRNLPYIDFEPLMRRIARRALYRLADAVFAISGEVRDYYCRETGFPPERMRVIPNGIDVSRIHLGAAGSAREELGISKDAFVIGTVARLDATKNTITLAKGFAELYKKAPSPDLKLLIVGDGDQKTTIEKFAEDSGLERAVIFTGIRKDVPALLGAMDVFSLTSLSEGMPITVLEAMSASLPVVATRVGSLHELVEEGVTGFLIQPRDPRAVAEKLAELYENRELAGSLGRAGRLKVEKDYGLDRMLKRYADLYRSLLNY